MYLVIVHSWLEATAELMQAMAAVLGISAFEVRQRLAGNGPAVVARLANAAQAAELARKLGGCGVATMVVDIAGFRSNAGGFVVRRFELGAGSLHVEAAGGATAEFAYGDVALLLPAICVVAKTETVKVTGKKLKLGATLLSGGIPIMKKTERQEEVRTEEREKALFLHAGDGPAVVFRQDGMRYDGLGAEMKPSRESNFAFLVHELRRLCPAAAYDERLLQRAGQARVLGPTFDPDVNLDLSVEIVARSIRSPGLEKLLPG